MFLLGYAVNDLESGVTEIHRHWWSTLAVGLVALGAAARVAVELLAARRQERPTG